ncbi:hypothetical protein JOE11_002135 [Robbsia andropogonis]|uniref:hypothetical protein n=1 Tax=Robbsia andropogonis TaxID=28092 RepID=UPI00209FFF2A|nr:hypothetical protein [Robbsia andropogonis]MCP1117267.1 hypothetical protein [Robbsia andropogonis]MCP1129339.1 hypothetical protein [Robbsia andropogonis]
MKNAKILINRRLAVLLGMGISAIHCAAGMLTLQFGQLKQITSYRGTVKQIGEWALHVQCMWQVEQSGNILVNQEGLHTDEDTHRTMGILNGLFIDSVRAIVERVQTEDFGRIKISLTDGLTLVVTPNSDGQDEDWRFFAPGKEEAHFVIEAGKIDPDSLPSADAPNEKRPWWKWWSINRRNPRALLRQRSDG